MEVRILKCVRLKREVSVQEKVQQFISLHSTSFFLSLHENLERTTFQLRKFDYVFAPDYSIYVDGSLQPNKQAVYDNHLAAAHWQRIGYNVIPTASWGDVDSLRWCFEGLPQHSVIAVCGQGHRKTRGQHTLWVWAIQEVVAQLSPTQILIIGEEEDIPGVHTPLKFYPDYIHTTLRQYGRK